MDCPECGHEIEAKILKFTPRMYSVAIRLLASMENKDIAKDLGISLRTVKLHCRKLYEMFNIHTGCKKVKLVVLLYRRRAEWNYHSLEEERVVAVSSPVKAKLVLSIPPPLVHLPIVKEVLPYLYTKDTQTKKSG